MLGLKPITAKNFLYECWAYRRDILQPKNLASNEYSDIVDVLVHMLDSLEFYLDPAFMRHGVPKCYTEIFTSSCEAGKLTFEHSKRSWDNCLFREAQRCRPCKYQKT